MALAHYRDLVRSNMFCCNSIISISSSISISISNDGKQSKNSSHALSIISLENNWKAKLKNSSWSCHSFEPFSHPLEREKIMIFLPDSDSADYGAQNCECFDDTDDEIPVSGKSALGHCNQIVVLQLCSKIHSGFSS